MAATTRVRREQWRVTCTLWLASPLSAVPIGVGVGIGVDSACPVIRGFLVNRVSPLPKLCEQHHDPVQQDLGLLVLLCGHRTANLQNVQRNRLRRTEQLVLRVAVSGQRLAESIRPADLLDGGALHV
jgi:hypothetical protein